MLETIKSIFRWLRKKFHNDLNEKLDALHNDLHALAQAQAQVQSELLKDYLEAQAQVQSELLKDYLDAVLNN